MGRDVHSFAHMFAKIDARIVLLLWAVVCLVEDQHTGQGNSSQVCWAEPFRQFSDGSRGFVHPYKRVVFDLVISDYSGAYLETQKGHCGAYTDGNDNGECCLPTLSMSPSQSYGMG